MPSRVLSLLVRSEDPGWRLGIYLCGVLLGLTRADYLQQIVKDNALPSITRQDEDEHPCITRKKRESSTCITRYQEEIEILKAEILNLSQKNAALMEQATIVFPPVVDLEALRDRVLFDLKLGKQASGYKAAQKALNFFIAQLTHSKLDVFWLRQQYQ